MKRMVVAVLFSLALIPAAQAQVKDSAVVVDETEAVVTVTKVDKEARKVTFRGPKGGVATLTVPKEAQNLDQVKPGQQYKLKYVEAVAVEIRKGGKPAAAASEEVKLAPKGAKPGGTVVAPCTSPASLMRSTTPTATSRCAGRRATRCR